MRRGVSAGILVLLAVAALALPLRANAAWTQPVDLSRFNNPIGLPQAGVDADGDAVFVWEQGSKSQVMARARDADGVLHPVQSVSSGRWSGIAVNAIGDAVFVWQQGDGSNSRIAARTRAADGALGPKQVLSAPGQDAIYPQVAVNPAGEAAFAWWRYDGSTWRLQTRTRAADGTLGPSRTLASAGRNQLWPWPRVVIDSEGNELVAWLRMSLGEKPRIVCRVVEADGKLRPVQPVSPTNVPADKPEVELDASGNAVFAWQGYDGRDPMIQTRTRAADGTLGPTQTVSPPGREAFTSFNRPQLVGVDAAGSAVFSWLSRYDITDQTVVQARTRAADGTLGPIETLGPAGNVLDGPLVARDPSGDAVVAWQDNGASRRIRARTLAPDGTVGPLRALSAPDESVSLAEVAVGAGGDFAVPWIDHSRHDLDSGKIQAAFGP